MAVPQIQSAETIEQQQGERFRDSRCGEGLSWKTLISASKTPTDTLTAGIATCAPGDSFLCQHQHTHAELYHITEGEGVVEIGGVEHAVKTGSVVFIPGNERHGIRNASASHPLVWLYVFAADDFDEVKYQFSHDVGNGA